MNISGINISNNYHWHSLTVAVDDTITRNGSFTANHHLDDARHTCHTAGGAPGLVVLPGGKQELCALRTEEREEVPDCFSVPHLSLYSVSTSPVEYESWRWSLSKTEWRFDGGLHLFTAYLCFMWIIWLIQFCLKLFAFTPDGKHCWMIQKENVVSNVSEAELKVERAIASAAEILDIGPR